MFRPESDSELIARFRSGTSLAPQIRRLEENNPLSILICKPFINLQASIIQNSMIKPSIPKIQTPSAKPHPIAFKPLV